LCKGSTRLIFEQEKKMGPRIQSPASEPSSASLKRKATTDEILVEDDIAVSHAFGKVKNSQRFKLPRSSKAARLKTKNSKPKRSQFSNICLPLRSRMNL
jgi:hypothetical protein